MNIAFNIKWMGWIYIFLLFLIAVLPINGKESKVNHTFVFHLRLDYFFHILLFLPWMSLLLFNTQSATNFILQPFSWFVLGFVLVFITEGVQYFIPYRAFNTKDLVSNTSGLLIGTMAYMLLKTKYFKNKNKNTF